MKMHNTRTEGTERAVWAHCLSGGKQRPMQHRGSQQHCCGGGVGGGGGGQRWERTRTDFEVSGSSMKGQLDTSRESYLCVCVCVCVCVCARARARENARARLYTLTITRCCVPITTRARCVCVCVLCVCVCVCVCEREREREREREEGGRERERERERESVCEPSFSLSQFVSLFLILLSLSTTCLSVLVDRLVGLVVRRPPRERKVPGSNPACDGIFSGSSHTSDFKIGTPVATLPGAWRYRVSVGTGRPGVSIL